MSVGFTKEWICCKLNEVLTRRIRLIKPEQRIEVFDNSDCFNPRGCLHPQWIRRDLLGMPIEWEDDVTFIIPNSAFDRVAEELEEINIEFKEC